MGLFKRLFGSKPSNSQHADAQVPWMTPRRLENLRISKEAGFHPANSLPTDWDKTLRPVEEIAGRLHAIKALILWVLAPEDQAPAEKVKGFIEKNDLKRFLTEDELEMLNSDRQDEDSVNAIGWKFENAWPLAWYFGHAEPEMFGKMMEGPEIQPILSEYTCSLDDSVNEWAQKQTTISHEDLEVKEDLFYCLHNAVRSAKIGRETVPSGFHQIANGGVIHERRHSLTWMLSGGIDWDDTDLST